MRTGFRMKVEKGIKKIIFYEAREPRWFYHAPYKFIYELLKYKWEKHKFSLSDIEYFQRRLMPNFGLPKAYLGKPENQCAKTLLF